MARYLIPPPPDPVMRAEWEAGVAAREAAEAAGAVFRPPQVRPVRQDRPVIVYMDMNEIGALFGVTGRTVSSWRRRYAATHPCPEPDAMTGQTPGWLPERADEWRAWHAARTGQGKGGGRPRRQVSE